MNFMWFWTLVFAPIKSIDTVVSITLFISVPCYVCVSSCHEHLYVYVILVLNRKFVVFSVFKKNINILSFLDLRVLWFRYLIFQVFFF
jgi:hypothetical protein